MKESLKDYCKGVRGLIFDYGGTLDTRGDHWSVVLLNSWRKVLGDHINEPLFRDSYVEGERAMARARIILPEDDFFETLRKKILVELSRYGVLSGQLISADEKEVAEKIIRAREEIARQIASDSDMQARRQIEESKKVLETLGERFPMVLVSNFYGNVVRVLEEYDVARFFKSVVESAVVGVRKPNPKIFALGVEELGLRPEEVLVVGDTYKKDIEPALTLGCKAVWIKGKGWTEEDDSVKYAFTIRNLKELEACLIDKN